MLDKEVVFAHVAAELSSKIEALQIEFDELQKALKTETKSSAGDKHETGRAMAQLEQEKLSVQLTKTYALRDALSKVDPNQTHHIVQYGSLVKTSRGFFFFSVGLGNISVDTENVFCMTATSPLGEKLLGKKMGDTIQMNGPIEIIGLC
ncbi:3-oxoacyl-ACP synthase [Crocinitomicaceae bacterium]|nr:3-oxoacyl-ACP synthase [Crocinitomicaceae bacterium]